MTPAGGSCQLPEWPPDIACEVEPKPPREVVDVDEPDDVELPLWSELLLDAKPTEVEFDGRFEVLFVFDPQPQLPQ